MSILRFMTLLCLVTLLPTFFAQPLDAQLVADPESFLDRGPGAAPNERFGSAVARGDFNGDGWHDLAVTVPGLDVAGLSQAGAVFIYFGASDGLAIAPSLQLTAENGLPGSDCTLPAQLGRFGNALAVADFNQDGFEDLAIGAPKAPAVVNGDELRDVGAVSVFWGAADSSLTAQRCFMPGRDGLPGVLERFGDFGFALAVGDFESDGFPDLAIGAPRATVNDAFEGTVTVIYSRPGEPLTVSGSQLWHQDSPGIAGVASPNDRFGAALASGDLVLGLDTACDLVIGVPDDDLDLQDDFQGSVQVLFGCTPTGLSSEDSVQWTAENCLLNGVLPNAGFGTALAVGNFDGQGAHDLAIGAPRYGIFNSQFGAVCMIYGNQQMPDQVTTDSLNKFDVTDTFQGDVFGRALTTLSVEGELDSLLVGAPGSDGDSNVPSFLLYQPEPITGFDPTQGFHFTLGPGFAEHDLGFAMTTGRFDERGPLAVVGAPGLERHGLDGAGGVWLLPRSEIFSDGFETGDLRHWSAVVD